MILKKPTIWGMRCLKYTVQPIYFFVEGLPKFEHFLDIFRIQLMFTLPKIFDQANANAITLF